MSKVFLGACAVISILTAFLFYRPVFANSGKGTVASGPACDEKATVLIQSGDAYELKLHVPLVFWHGKEPKVAPRTPLTLGGIQASDKFSAPHLIAACLPDNGQEFKSLLYLAIGGKRNIETSEDVAKGLIDGGYKDSGIYGHFHRYTHPSRPGSILISSPGEFMRPMTVVCGPDPGTSDASVPTTCTIQLFYSAHIKAALSISSSNPLSDIQVINQQIVTFIDNLEPQPAE
jgi:hypothetical protein